MGFTICNRELIREASRR